MAEASPGFGGAPLAEAVQVAEAVPAEEALPEPEADAEAPPDSVPAEAEAAVEEEEEEEAAPEPEAEPEEPAEAEEQEAAPEPEVEPEDPAAAADEEAAPEPEADPEEPAAAEEPEQEPEPESEPEAEPEAQPEPETEDEEVENADENAVVDLSGAVEPDQEVAHAYQLLYRPAYIEVEDEETKETVRAPCDRGHCDQDPNGYLTTKVDGKQEAKPYPLWDTTDDDLGMMGGVGMRQYYMILKSLTFLFLVLGTLSTPALIIYAKGDMYEHPAAVRFAEVFGSHQTKGNIIASDEEIENGSAGELWLGSITNALVALAVIAYTLRMGKEMSEIVTEVDEETITMSDYTIRLVPVADSCIPNRSQVWEEYRVSATAQGGQKQEGGKRDQEKKLKDVIKETLQKEFGEIAEIDQEPAIWLGWDEQEHIAYWNQKKALLFQLEAAMNLKLKGAEGDAEAVAEAEAGLEDVLTQIAEINAHLIDLNTDGGDYAKHNWVPVTAFVTFESDDTYDKALKAKYLPDVGGRRCKIVQAPEPETLKWANLEYGWWARWARSVVIFTTTVAMLIVGVWLINGMYIRQCASCLADSLVRCLLLVYQQEILPVRFTLRGFGLTQSSGCWIDLGCVYRLQRIEGGAVIHRPMRGDSRR
jgi:hypothetical protein